MKTYVLTLTMVIVALGASVPTDAKACDNFGYGGYGGWGIGYLYDNLQYNVPHFAAFPPVYYSYPVARTYGYSPFAYPPGVMTPDVIDEVAPLEIINPHVPSSHENRSAAPEDHQVSVESRPEPLVIDNPYVTPSRSVARTE